jgi:cell division protein FtsL
MATLATFLRRVNVGTFAAESETEQAWVEARDPFMLRPIPCEDVYFFCKKIDNSRVVRESDPRANRKALKTIGLFSLATLFLLGLLLPKALGVAAGYQLHSLQQERTHLMNEKSALELEEARLLSPQRLEELARSLEFADPAPGQVVHLNPKPDSAIAMMIHSK